jgi:hypothetical protein
MYTEKDLYKTNLYGPSTYPCIRRINNSWTTIVVKK